MTRRNRGMLFVIVAGLVVLVGSGVTALFQLWSVTIVLLVFGVIIILFAVFRRFGRPGDFNRSGWTGS